MINDINVLIDRWVTRINKSSLRTRVALLSVSTALMGGVWFYALQADLRVQRVDKAERIAKLSQQVQYFSSQTQAITQQIQHDLSMHVNRSFTPEHEEVALLNASNKLIVADVLTTQEMLHLFSSKLRQVNGITLLRLYDLPPKPLAQVHEQLSAANKSEYDDLVRNGVAIAFIADYFSTLRFLQLLEANKPNFFWDKFSYKVTQYPYALVKMRVYFISHQPTVAAPPVQQITG